jgi:transposase
VERIMARSKNGQAIGAARRTPEALAELDAFIEDAESRGALDEWRRGRAVRLYVQGERVVAMFNGHTFHQFLLLVVANFAPRKVFMIIDNGSCHWLDEPGKRWLADNEDKIELIRLPPYSPAFNPVEGIWKCTRKRATHNRFYRAEEERDGALTMTFEDYKSHPEQIAGHVARFQ